MIFHENRLLVDDSHEISFLISFKNWEKMLPNLSSAAVVIGALRAIVMEGEDLAMLYHLSSPRMSTVCPS